MPRHATPTAFISITPTMRRLIENTIEDLLLLLDEIDGDADIEEDEDFEPSLGAVIDNRGCWQTGGTDDRELADDSEEGDPDGLETEDHD